jgi:uncharacterized coiled-coil protein SlyX
MPLEATLKTLEGLSEEVAALYSEMEGGGYQLSVEGFVPADKVEEDTHGLKKALNVERESVSKMKGQLRALQEKFAGIDIDEFEELRQAKAEAAEAEAERKGEWESLKSQMRESHSEALGKKDSVIERMRREIERLTVDSQATAAINEAEGNVTLLTPHVKSLVKLVEEDGKFKPQVVDAAGNPRVDGEGNPLTIRALVSEMRDQDVYKGAFKGSGAAGGGTPPGDGGEGNPEVPGGGTPPKTATGKARSAMTPREKVDFINEHGNDKFMELPA